MRRFGQHAKLKQNKIEEYKKLHSAIWPEVLKTISKCNIKNYSIYIMGNDLFTYFEYVGGNYGEDMKKMDEDPITQQWWKHTKPCFLYHNKKLYYSDMKEIFHCD